MEDNGLLADLLLKRSKRVIIEPEFIMPGRPQFDMSVFDLLDLMPLYAKYKDAALTTYLSIVWQLPLNNQEEQVLEEIKVIIANNSPFKFIELREILRNRGLI